MLLNAITFSRYRAFLEETRVEIRPLTIIIGKNGGGKSVLTRLPLLLASGLESSANTPLDLTAGGISHATRYEDLIYQRSAQPFSLGAEISDGTRTLAFRSTLRHIVETRTLALESFELSENGKVQLHLTLLSPEDLGKAHAEFRVDDLTTARSSSTTASIVGLFPIAVTEDIAVTNRLAAARVLFATALEQPSYLGPFRFARDRLARIPQQGVRDFGSRGERTLDFLGDDALRGSGDLGRAVERWFDAEMGGNKVHMDRTGDTLRMTVFDPLRNIEIDLSETGAGFSQVLPIVVQAYARQLRIISSSLLIVEQPELHLHPAAHGGVADLLVETSRVCGNSTRYICETHSEQIVARLRRRIADSSIPADSVCILSVGHQGIANSEIEPLRTITFDSYGSPSAWPTGVFDEAFDDLVHIRESARQKH